METISYRYGRLLQPDLARTCTGPGGPGLVLDPGLALGPGHSLLQGWLQVLGLLEGWTGQLSGPLESASRVFLTNVCLNNCTKLDRIIKYKIIENI